jgi:dienelactone hydrolase
MAVATEVRPAVRHSSDDRPRRGGRVPLRRVSRTSTGIVGTGLTLIVLDGSWWWAIARVLLVGAVISRAMTAGEHRSRRATGITAAAIGLVGMAVGGAISVSYLPGGWGIRSVGGVLAAVGGLVSFVFGTVVAVRSTRGWRKLLAVPIVLVAAYGVGFPVVVSVYATNVGRPELGPETPADRGLAFVDASFTTSDGVQLSGWYVPSRNGAAVVLLHGASSTRSAVLDQAVVLARHGYGVLLYDARGMGLSAGRAMNFGWYGDRDLAAAISFLETRADVDAGRIGAVGESMGGEEAIGAMATDPRLRAVVAEGATNRVNGDWGWLADEHGIRGRVQQGVNWFAFGLTDLLTDASPPITLREAVAIARRPVLLIAAGNVADEAGADGYIEAAAPDSVDVWVVPGANHVGGLRAQPAEWDQRVTSFLDAHLAPSGE